MTIPPTSGFDWHCEKYEENIRCHDVRFETAAEIFGDPDLVSYEDRRFAYGETRYAAIGRYDGEFLFVAYTYRDSGGEDVIRLISARYAERREIDGYLEQFDPFS